MKEGFHRFGKIIRFLPAVCKWNFNKKYGTKRENKF